MSLANILIVIRDLTNYDFLGLLPWIDQYRDFRSIFQTEKERSFIWCVDTTVCVNLCKKLFRCPRFLYSTHTHTITSDNETKLIEANFDRGTLKTDIETSETVNREACVGTWLKNGYNTNYRGSNSRNC